MTEYWKGDFCTKSVGFSHALDCPSSYVVCPHCGLKNPGYKPDSSSTTIRSQTPAALTIRSSPALHAVSSAHRQEAIVRNRNQQSTRPNAGAPQHQSRAHTAPTLSVPPPSPEPIFLHINGIILVQNEAGKWRIESKIFTAIVIGFTPF